MRIGILTGGGDVPGLNMCIKAVVDRAADNDWQVIGFRRGWAGPLHYNPDNRDPQPEWVEPLSREGVRTIDRSGGTYLHTSRTNPAKVKETDLPDFLKGSVLPGEDDVCDCTLHVLRVLDSLGIDALIPIGGDDTLSYGARLAQEGVRVISVPKTMDNDVFGTDYCIGFGTAVSRSIVFINALRTPTGSHERIGVIELFGRNSGETALISAYLADADRALISEVPFDVERLAELVLADRRDNPSHYAMIVVSEGARETSGGVVERGETDAFGHRKLGGIGDILSEDLKRLTGVGIVNQKLAYLMRAGAPDALDRMVAMSYGNLAVQQLEKGASGRMLALRDGCYTTVPAEMCIQGVKRVDVAELYDSENYRPNVSHLLGKPMFLY